MYYINATPRESGDYGNPMGQVFPGCVALPDELLGSYIEAMGFVYLEVEDGEVVASLEVNQEALDAYLAEHPDVPAQPDEPTPDPIEVLQEENKLLKSQVQALSDQNDFQEELIVELANVIYA